MSGPKGKYTTQNQKAKQNIINGYTGGHDPEIMIELNQRCQIAHVCSVFIQTMEEETIRNN